MSEILDKSSFRDELPETAHEAGEKPVTSEKPEKPESKAESKPASEKPQAPAKADEKHDEEAEEAHPDSFEGYRKALDAARGDKRTARKKWQEAEKARHALELEHARIRARLEVFERQTAPQQQPATQPKPQQPLKLGDQLYAPETMEEYLNQRFAAESERLRAEFREREEARRKRSFDKARKSHEDFDQVFAATLEMVRGSPQIEAQILNEDDVGEAAYLYGRQYLELRGVNSLDDLKARYRTEWEAEQAEKAPQVPAATPTLPPAPKNPIPRSLAASRGTGAGVAPQWTGPRAMSDILSR